MHCILVKLANFNNFPVLFELVKWGQSNFECRYNHQQFMERDIWCVQANFQQPVSVKYVMHLLLWQGYHSRLSVVDNFQVGLKRTCVCLEWPCCRRLWYCGCCCQHSEPQHWLGMLQKLFQVWCRRPSLEGECSGRCIAPVVEIRARSWKLPERFTDHATGMFWKLMAQEQTS